MLSKLRPGGTLVLNTTFTDMDKLEQFLPVPVSAEPLSPSALPLPPLRGCPESLSPSAPPPPQVKKRLAAMNVEFYVIDGRAVADAAGLGKHVNMVMQVRGGGRQAVADS